MTLNASQAGAVVVLHGAGRVGVPGSAVLRLLSGMTHDHAVPGNRTFVVAMGALSYTFRVVN